MNAKTQRNRATLARAKADNALSALINHVNAGQPVPAEVLAALNAPVALRATTNLNHAALWLRTIAHHMTGPYAPVIAEISKFADAAANTLAEYAANKTQRKGA